MKTVVQSLQKEGVTGGGGGGGFTLKFTHPSMHKVTVSYKCVSMLLLC